MSPREPSGRHATLAASAPYEQIRGEERTPIPVMPAWQPVAAPAPVGVDVSIWTRIKDIGFPIAAAVAVGGFVVRKDDQALKERTEMAKEHRAQLNLILDAHGKDREIIRQALERQNALLEQLPARMREAIRSAGGRTRERGDR